MSDKIFLTDAPAALRPHGVRVTYHALWQRAVCGDIPADRVGKRWAIEARDLPAIAATFTPQA